MNDEERACSLRASAVLANQEERHDEAMQLYEEAISLLIGLCKRNDARRAHYEHVANLYLTEAETSKEAKLAKTAKGSSSSIFSIFGLGTSSSSSSPAASSTPAARLPDVHDYTLGVRKASSSSSSSSSGSNIGGIKAPSSSSTLASATASSGVARANAASTGAGIAVPSAYEASIQEEMMIASPNVKWTDIAGLAFAKATLQEAVVLPALRPDLFTGLRAPPKGVLLFGPPGTGKTLIAKAVATEARCSFFAVSPSSLTSKYLGEGEKLMRALFTLARRQQPSVVFFDEIDSLLGSRNESEHEASRRLKTEFLTQVDGCVSATADRVLVLGATNLPWELDEAVTRRMVKRVYIPLPDAASRTALIRHLLAGKPQEDQRQNTSNQIALSEADIEEIVARTEGLSGSDLAALCAEAAMGPIRELRPSQLIEIKAEEMRAININDFVLALNVVRPSVSSEHLVRFQQYTDEHGAR